MIVTASRVRQVVVLCSVNDARHCLGGFVSGRYGDVVFKAGLTVYQITLI